MTPLEDLLLFSSSLYEVVSERKSLVRSKYFLAYYGIHLLLKVALIINNCIPKNAVSQLFHYTQQQMILP